jgi:TetR/AcrR family transcriptional regulator
MEKDTREKLIDAATPLFAWKGFAGVSIRELATAAEVNSALISYHFGGKEGLYAAVLEAHMASLVSVIEKVSQSSPDPEVRIENFVRTVCKRHKEQPYLLRLIQGELTNPTACFESVIKVFFKRLVTFLPAAIQDGKDVGQFAQEVHPFYAGVALASMINFYFIVKPLADHIIPDDGNRDEEYIRQVLQIYLNGVRRSNREKASDSGSVDCRSNNSDISGD